MALAMAGFRSRQLLPLGAYPVLLTAHCPPARMPIQLYDSLERKLKSLAPSHPDGVFQANHEI